MRLHTSRSRNTPPPDTSQQMLLSPAEAAKYLGLRSAGTLAVWRATRRYPLSYVKVGARIRYRLADLNSFLRDRTVVVEAHT